MGWGREEEARETMEDPLWKALGDRKDFSMNHKRDTDQFHQSEKKMINSIGHTEFEEPRNKEFYQAIKKFMTET